MALKGKIAVEITPVEASCVAGWLAGQKNNSTHPGLLQVAVSAPDLDKLIRRMARVAKPRPTRLNLFRPVVVQLDRADVAWFGAQVRRRGLFGHRAPQPTSWVATFCTRCLVKVTTKRGRPKLTGLALEQRLSWIALDERHRKRLKSRRRAEKAIYAKYGGLLATDTGITGN